MDPRQVLTSIPISVVDAARRGIFFRGAFDLSTAADTYIDMTSYQKGIVWVNGNSLGRYWDIGPQRRLYCPAPRLRQGRNEILVFNLLQTEAKTICGKTALY